MTEQMHVMIAPDVRIEQTRRRLVKLRDEGLVDRVTLAQAGRARVWFVTQYGLDVLRWQEVSKRIARSFLFHPPSPVGCAPGHDVWGPRPCRQRTLGRFARRRTTASARLRFLEQGAETDGGCQESTARPAISARRPLRRSPPAPPRHSRGIL
ncbi:replication-relaxation family protein [Streptomyces sp. NPDC056462]|uniref:replication-relaxation family protein n=1 Tax=Streptomyces sp. NPDC056462 TaxID=3345826 RepID=UPI0036C6C8A4